MSPRRTRDELVGGALRELRVPEHRPGFWTDLEAALPRRRRPRRVPPRLRLGLAAAAAAVVVALVIGLPRPGAPPPALADVVKARVEGALASLRTLQGRAAYRSRDPHDGTLSTQRYRFAATGDGDFRLIERGGPGELAYDASAGTERAVTTSASIGAGRFFTLRRGVAPGPPDRGPSDWILNRRLGAAVRALLAAHDPAVHERTYDGRPAWSVDLHVRPNAIAPDVDRIRVTIDQRTGIPVAVVSSLGGRLHDALRLRRLRVNADLGRRPFAVDFPAGAEVATSDEGFRRVDLAAAARALPYAPLVPGSVPDGYRLATVAVARRAAPTGAEAANPPSRSVLSLTYRRGLQSFTVSTRLSGGLTGRWDDPAAAGEGIREPSEHVRLAGGALDGTPAELVLGPRSQPHVWAVTDRLVVTVAGDLGRSELLRVAGSLTARTP